MRVFHDSRDIEYRSPFGAVPVGGEVEFALDVYDACGSVVELRTWADGVGERLHEMQLDEPAVVAATDDGYGSDEPVLDDGCGSGGEPALDNGYGSGEPVRYRIVFAPEQAGIVWYQFRITDAEGRMWRYGARNGRLGGDGQLVGWEPPSFCLSVYSPHAAPPAWYEPIGGYLYDGGACHDLPEVVAALCENYPAALALTTAPWDFEGDETACPEGLPGMRQALDAASETACAWFAEGEDVFGFWRVCSDGAMTCALFNASTDAVRDIAVPMVEAEASELVAGYEVDVEEGREPCALVKLRPMGEAVLHFHPKEQLARPMGQGVGVLAHVTSLPSDGKGRLGMLGAQARAFIDWLAEAGMRYWQVLPVGPTDEYGSPYAGISAFAGNTRLLEGGKPTPETLKAVGESAEYRSFCEREADWLEPYACFMAIRQRRGPGVMWQEWPKRYRRYSPSLLGKDEGLAHAAEEVRRSQFLFERQWGEMRAYANERGIRVIGDMPIYVSADSADVWAHPELFQLGPDGMPHVVAGCPPDAFAVDGQVWGNPVYDWDAMRESGYAWWLRRLQRAFGLYDYVRLDHFIGFSRYFSIPAGEKAADGTYHRGPGFELFRLAREKFGPLPIIAEDLGLITPRVRSLVASCGFPGMDIIQFADGGDPLSQYTPRPEKVVYTGTHDNQTLLGYVRSRYPHECEGEAFDSLVERVVGCGAPVRILPLQDVLRLGDEARMNVPGVAEGNWAWQADAADIAAALDYAKELSGA